MYYVIDGNNIVFEYENLKLFQPLDPSTSLPFKSRKDQVKWVEDFLKGYYTTSKAIVSFYDTDDNEIQSLYSDIPFKLKVETNIKKDFTINIKIISDSGYDNDMELNFKDGTAVCDLELSKSEKYYILFNEYVTVDDTTTCLVHEQHEYMMYIGN